MRDREHTMNNGNGAAMDTPQDAKAHGDGGDPDFVFFQEDEGQEPAAAARRFLSSQMFLFNGAQVRTVLKSGEPWFIAADVCTVLEVANSRDAVSRLDDDEKGVAITDTLGGKQEMTVINESGLYHLVWTSTKPEAKAFRRWVTQEVLPSIRRTGAYRADSSAHQTIGSGNATFTVPGPGRYVILALLNGEMNVHQTEYTTVIPELTALHCRIMANACITIASYWQWVQETKGIGCDRGSPFPLSQLEKEVLNAAGVRGGRENSALPHFAWIVTGEHWCLFQTTCLPIK